MVSNKQKAAGKNNLRKAQILRVGRRGTHYKKKVR